MDMNRSAGAFAVPDLLCQSSLTAPQDEIDSLFPTPELDVTLIKLQNPYALKSSLENGLRLPELETFRYGPIELPDLPDDSVTSAETDAQSEADNGDEDDLWIGALELHPAWNSQKYFTWEEFFRVDAVETRAPYISEWGPGAFDASLRTLSKRASRSDIAGPIVQGDIALKALYDLGLGRSSRLFYYDLKTRTFKPTVESPTVTGYSSVAFKSMFHRMAACGLAFRKLRRFSERSCSALSIPSRVALANAVSAILQALESYLGQMRLPVKSLLQLEHLFERPRHLLEEIVAVVASLVDATSDEELASRMFACFQRVESDASWLRLIMREILSRTTTPLLDRVTAWIGLGNHSLTAWNSADPNLSFVHPGRSRDGVASSLSEFSFRHELLPKFLSAEDGRTIFELGQSIRLLKNHNPEHMLVCRSCAAPSLEWKFDWTDVDSVVQIAQQFEAKLANAVRICTKSKSELSTSIIPTPSEPIETATNPYELQIVSSIETFNSLPQPQSDTLLDLTLRSLFNTSPQSDLNPISTIPASLLAPLSFSPLLTAQSRLVKRACLNLLFTAHGGLRKHLALQRAFHLMGDGVFVARLSAALFSSGVHSTERKAGQVRAGAGSGSMGLTLVGGERASWPPASSELRLALMGLLGDCYRSRPELHTSMGGATLPGGMSFAIRTLPAEADQAAIAAMADPASLEALDFLRLAYVPPAPLDVVLTPAAMARYDVAFKFLLRMQRVLFVAARLPPWTKGRGPADRGLLEFVAEARHFVNSCAAHFFGTVVVRCWGSLMDRLDRLEASLGSGEDVVGIDALRAAHEAMLDRMLRGLLLRRRQLKLMAVLENALGCVLRLDVMCRRGGGVPLEQDGKALEELRVGFTDKVRVFLEACRGLSGRRTYGGDEDSDGGFLDELVLVLDFNGFWS